MELDFAKNLRELRIKQGITQEELAEKLGMSSQTVSRWENSSKVSYPDVETLPVIADFFNVTVDELLGCDSARSKEKLRLYWEEYDSLKGDGEKQLSLLKKMNGDYPRDMDIMFEICNLVGGDRDLRFAEGSADLVRGMVEYIMENSTDRWMREWSVSRLILVEKEERLSEALEKYTSVSDMTQNKLLQWRYARLGEEYIDKYEDILQRNLLDSIRDFWGIRCYSKRKSESSSFEYEIRRKKMQFGVIEAFSDVARKNPVSGDGEVDLWSSDRIVCGLWFACECCMKKDAEGALSILEDTVSLAEKFFSLEEGSVLTFRSTFLDKLEARVEYKKRENGVSFRAPITTREKTMYFFALKNTFISEFLSCEEHLGSFEILRDDERFGEILRRARVIGEMSC